MAKKKAAPEAPPPESEKAQVSIITLKGTKDYAEFLNLAHEKTHIAKATIVRLALKDWFKKNGLGEPPSL